MILNSNETTLIVISYNFFNLYIFTFDVTVKTKLVFKSWSTFYPGLGKLEEIMLDKKRGLR